MANNLFSDKRLLAGVVPDQENCIFIPGNTPSSKNSKQIIVLKKKTGEQFHTLIDSELTKKWKKEIKDYMAIYKRPFLDMSKKFEYPLYIQFTFVRNSARDFDYINPCQAIQDMMVEYGWLPDDNTKFIKPFFGDVIIDRDQPGVYIKILK